MPEARLFKNIYVVGTDTLRMFVHRNVRVHYSGMERLCRMSNRHPDEVGFVGNDNGR